jgi:hypothetical protein
MAQEHAQEHAQGWYSQNNLGTFFDNSCDWSSLLKIDVSLSLYESNHKIA